MLLHERRGMSVDDERITVVTGNLYEAMGLPDADEMYTKSKLVICIQRVMEERGYTQTQLAEIVGTDQPKISNILRGRFRGVSIWKLLEFLNALDQDVEIVVRPKRAESERGKTLVHPHLGTSHEEVLVAEERQRYAAEG